jgi:hypothetical protein
VVWPKSAGSRLPVGRRFAIKVGFPASGATRLYALTVVE